MRIFKAFNLVVCLALFNISVYPQTTAQSVAYQINSTHTGSIQSVGITPPLRKRWSVDLGQTVSYPIIAGGKVFVTVRNQSVYGTKLYALDAANGAIAWGPIDLGGIYYRSGICYENGRVFALNGSGLLRAFDANNGNQLWSIQLPNQYFFSSPPVAYKGIVYTDGSGSGGTLYAVNAETGALLWTTSVVNGSQCAPAVTDEGVYVSYVCPNVYKFDPINGSLLWRYSPGCSGGGGKTPVLHDNRLYVRYSSNYIFDSQTGTNLGTFDSTTTPAFAGNMGFFLNSYATPDNKLTLQALDLSNNITMWKFTGDGSLTSAPIIVDNYVYIGSYNGMFYALDPQTGTILWSTNVGASIQHPDEHNVSQPLTGLGAGEGIIVVPASSMLIAFDGDRTPPVLTWGNPDPSPNAKGWNNSLVAIPYTTSDDYSGVDTSNPSSPIYFNSEGANQTQTVTVKDRAGNVASFISPAVNIDFTKPITSHSAYGTVGNDNWYRGPVTISLSGSDTLSGLASSHYSIDGSSTQTYSNQFAVSGDGSHSITYWSVDNAGNTEAQKSLTIKIDSLAPALYVTANPSRIRATKKLVPVTISGSIKDSVSGLKAGSAVYTVVDEYGVVQPSGSITVQSDGSYSFPISLMASRNRNDYDGRIYTITVRGYDQAGNIGQASTMVKIY
jgi:outer membrane protein assembly factor BamB